ncbi:MAG: aminopeptidase P family protein [Clostridia bacterium]
MSIRCDRLVESANAVGMDAILVTSMTHMQYFSGFTGDNGVLIITADTRLLFTDFRYTIQANQQVEGEFEVIEVSRGITPDLILGELRKRSVTSCGYEEENMTVKQFEKYGESEITMIPASSIMKKIRMVKSDAEIKNLIAAQGYADKAFSELLGMIAPGMTEKDVANELEYLMKKCGSDGKSFDTIVGSGENGALCHAVPTDRKLRHGDLVVIDFGAMKNGYHSDMTRTIAIGEPCDELKKIYKIVLAAHTLALRSVRPGIECVNLDAIARECIQSYGYGDNFGHSLGHGFGLEIHEGPSASTLSKDTLEPGNTITIEPGIYIENLGGVRIEDCVIVTKNGYLDPVTSAKTLLIIE